MFQIRGRGSERGGLFHPLTSDCSFESRKGPWVQSASDELGGLISIRRGTLKLQTSITTKTHLKNDAELDTKQILPPPVCECWTESRESSLFLCPYGRCLPTSPCSSHLSDCMFWMCSSRGLCPPARGDKTNELGIISLPGNQNHPEETLGMSKIDDTGRFFISADWSACIFGCIAFMEHPKLRQ